MIDTTDNPQVIEGFSAVRDTTIVILLSATRAILRGKSSVMKVIARRNSSFTEMTLKLLFRYSRVRVVSMLPNVECCE